MTNRPYENLFILYESNKTRRYSCFQLMPTKEKALIFNSVSVFSGWSLVRNRCVKKWAVYKGTHVNLFDSGSGIEYSSDWVLQHLFKNRRILYRINLPAPCNSKLFSSKLSSNLPARTASSTAKNLGKAATLSKMFYGNLKIPKILTKVSGV